MIALGAFVARIGTQQISINEAKELLDQKEGFDAAIDSLMRWNELVGRPYITDNLKTQTLLLRALVETEKQEPLAARTTMVTLTEKVAKAQKSLKAADSFDRAAQRLKAARADVRASLDDPNVSPRVARLSLDLRPPESSPDPSRTGPTDGRPDPPGPVRT